MTILKCIVRGVAMSIAVINSKCHNPKSLSLEDLLIECCKFGQPIVSKQKEGWYAKIDVFVTGKGIQFKAFSSFKEPSPRQAVLTMYNRLQTAIEKIKQTK